MRPKGIIIIIFILLNLSSGCGRMFIKSEKYEAQKKEQKRNKLLKRHRKITAEQKVIDGKLDDAAAQILIFTARQRHGRVMSIDERNLNNEYIKKVADAENETKKLQKKYDALESELNKIEQDLKKLDAP
ncbi:MAG: hypothetical protein PHX78_00135 [bacterium]|nr:hypothetical protein [bacterium]